FPAERPNAAFARMAAAADAPDGEAAWHAADLAFHQAILAGARNQFLKHLAPMIANTLQASFRLSVLSLDSARASLPMHRAAADAIIAGDAQAAQAALETLIRSAREDMVSRRDESSARETDNEAARDARTPAARHAREEDVDLGDRRSADGAVLPPA
ncbi:MAG: FCD domain-containing protein, partial [Rubrimonas sp.]